MQVLLYKGQQNMRILTLMNIEILRLLTGYQSTLSRGSMTAQFEPGLSLFKIWFPYYLSPRWKVYLATVVKKWESAIHGINQYPMDMYIIKTIIMLSTR